MTAHTHTRYGPIVALTAILLAGNAHATALGSGPVIVEFSPNADTFVRRGSRHTNEGSSPILRLRARGHRALVQFSTADIEAVTGGVNVVAAWLEFDVSHARGWGKEGRLIDIHRLTVPWTEGNGRVAHQNPSDRGTGSGATWRCPTDSDIANRKMDCSDGWDLRRNGDNPWADEASGSVLITNTQETTVQVDVTADVNAFLNGDSANYGWVLKKSVDHQGGRLVIASRESGHGPRLVVEVAQPVNPLVAIEDTYVRGGAKHTNEGAAPFLRLKASGNNRALVRFSTEALSAGMCVNPLISATLVFEIDETGPNWGPDGRVLTLHRMEQDWTEGNGWSAENKPAVRGDGPGATWMCSTDTNISDHQANCFSSWQMGKPQQDVHPWASTPTDSALVTSGQTGTLSFDVTEDVLAILAGDSPNYGWMLRKEAEGLSGWIRLHARESASPPVLILQVQ